MNINAVMITDIFEWNYSTLFCVFSPLNFVFAFFLLPNFLLQRCKGCSGCLFQTPTLMEKRPGAPSTDVRFKSERIDLAAPPALLLHLCKSASLSVGEF